MSGDDQRPEEQRNADSADAASLSCCENMSETCVVVTSSEGGQRLDRFLAASLTQFSRTRLQALIRAGQVVKLLPREVTPAEGQFAQAGERRAVSDPSMKIQAGEQYIVAMPPAEPAKPQPEQMPLDVVFEDQHLIVINKPAGLVVHPAPGHLHGTLVNGLLAHCGDSLSGIGGLRRPGIVHRLDKDTSGLLVVAKTDVAHKGLSEQFQAHGRDGRLSRRYRAIVWGVPSLPIGTIDAPLARSNHNRLKIAVVREGQGREAITRYKTLAAYYSEEGKPVASLLDCELETGRTHQIRVHMAHLHHPVLGDTTYGKGFASSASTLTTSQFVALQALGRQALHAAHLGFEHPITGKRLKFFVDPPADIQALLDAFSL